MLVFIVAIYLLNDIWYKTRYEIRFNYLYRKLCSIDVNKSWRDSFSFFFFFEASNRSIALKRQTREERGGSWVSSRIVSGNNCPVISETASTGGCTIIERRNVNDLHWQGYMKPPLSHAARIVFVLTGNWALLGEIVNQSFLPDTQWTWGSITPARMFREDRDLEN